MKKERLIDATEVERVFSRWLGEADGLAEREAIECCIEHIHDAPTVNTKSLRPVAHWVPVDPESDIEFECSKCKFVVSTEWDGCEDFNYCPCCGAKMVGDKEDD